MYMLFQFYLFIEQLIILFKIVDLKERNCFRTPRGFQCKHPTLSENIAHTLLLRFSFRF